MEGKTGTPEAHCATHTLTQLGSAWAPGFAGRAAHPATRCTGTLSTPSHNVQRARPDRAHLTAYIDNSQRARLCILIFIPIHTGPRTHNSTDSAPSPGRPIAIHSAHTAYNSASTHTKLHRTRVPTATAATTPHFTPHFPAPHKRRPSPSPAFGSTQPFAAEHAPCPPPASRPRALPQSPPPRGQARAPTGRLVRPGPPPSRRVPSLRPARSLARSLPPDLGRRPWGGRGRAEEGRGGEGDM